uniref:RNA-directed RNA polymerase n=1 Tax=Tetnovirus 1 TaxID=870711 RepID=E0A3Q9_9VIRU|nr:unknown [Tetnovirus 1]
MLYNIAHDLTILGYDISERSLSHPRIIVRPFLTELVSVLRDVAKEALITPVIVPTTLTGSLMAYVYYQVANTYDQHDNPLIRIPMNCIYTLSICFPYRTNISLNHKLSDDLPLIRDYYGMPITQKDWPTSNVGWYRRYFGTLRPNDQRLIYRYPRCPRSIPSLVRDYDWKLESVSPHPEEAAQRNAARFNLPSMALSMGYTPFTISGRPSEATLGFNLVYNYRDTERLLRGDVLTDRNAIILVDTDYYIDMPKLLTTGLPILMYTFVPQRLAGSTQGTNYYIDKHSQVHFRAAGGTTWNHYLWDYNHDYLTSPSVNNKIVSYQVYQTQLSENRRLIILFPKTVAPYLRRVEATPLVRARFNQGEYCLMKTKTEQQEISISMGDEHVLTLPLDVFFELRGRFRNWKQADILYNVACLEQNAKVLLQNKGYKTEDVNDVVARISVLHAYLRDHANQELYTLEHYTDMLHYRYDNGDLWGTTLKHAQRAAMLPLTTAPNVAPVTDADADKTMVFGRVDTVHNKIVPPHVFNSYAHEFIELTLNGVHNLHPMDLELVFRNQNGPQQKARRKFWFTQINPEPSTSVASFTKSESYAGIKWPRAITQTSTHNMIELSSFVYQLKQEVLKKQKWYGPGKTPLETVSRLRDIASQSTTLIEKDYSKFDGTISRWLRENVEIPLLLAAFEPQYHQRIVANINTELNAVAKSRNRVKYKTDGSRLSGSAITTDGNTIINAFVSYCSLRKTLSQQEAWTNMGLYYGDDGVDHHIDGVDYEHSAKMLGLDVKLHRVECGQPLGYLGRCYPNIWLSTTSYTPLERALSKLHLVNNTSICLTEALANKAAGYLVIDGQTPILSWYCQRILRLYNANPNTMTVQQKEDIASPWPQDDISLIRADIAMKYGDVATETNKRLILSWDLKGQPPVVLPINGVELNKDRPAQVLGHYLAEKPPILIKQQAYETKNIKEKDVPADGDCFFHCLREHGVNRGLSPMEMRKILRDYAKPFNVNDYPGDVFSQELQDHEPVGLEVVALTAYWLGIVIGVQCEERKAIFLCGGKGATYWIRYKQGHYTALYLNMRPNHTIPCDLVIYLRQKAECKHKAQNVERSDRDYNTYYEHVDQIFQPASQTCDVHDTYEGVNPSWKVAAQLKPANAKALCNTRAKTICQAVARVLGLKYHLACYIQVLCQQRQFYGKRQASMTDWDRELDMRIHPFMMVRNLASLLHLDVTVRFPTSKSVQMVRYSVVDPDQTLFFNYCEKTGTWFTDAPVVSTTSNATNSENQNHTNDKKSDEKRTSRKTNGGGNNQHQAEQPAQTSDKNGRQSGATNRQRSRFTRSGGNSPICTSRDGRHETTNASRFSSGNKAPKPVKIVRPMASKQIASPNKLGSVSNDQRSNTHRVVSHPRSNRRRRHNAKVVERATTHEEPASQKREPHAQPPDSN